MALTTPTDTLVCDTAQIARWQANPDYAYAHELVTPEVNVVEWLLRKLDRWLSQLFGNSVVDRYSSWILIGIFIVVLLLVVWFLYRKRPELFMRSRKQKPLDYAVEEDTIYGVDFAERIEQALAHADYRAGIRLLYLQTLKQLSDAGRIDWQLYKTPTQYISEVRMPAFRQLTNHFLRVRYGNFEATEALFHTMRALQEKVEKGGEE